MKVKPKVKVVCKDEIFRSLATTRETLLEQFTLAVDHSKGDKDKSMRSTIRIQDIDENASPSRNGTATSYLDFKRPL